MNITGMLKVAAGLCLLLMARNARADVVVVVSAKCPTTALTALEITQIYMGRSKALRPVDTAGNALRTEFYTKVAGKDDAQVRALWSRLVFTGKATAPRELSNSAEVVKFVAADPNVIGYIEKSAVDSSVKIVYTVQ
jgi:ABC-type phosphate transport system substrate-binding protein